MFRDLLRGLGTVRVGYPIVDLDDGGIHPDLLEALGYFEADVPPADDCCPLRRTLFYVLHYGVGVREEAQGEDTVQIRAVDGREDGLSTRGDDETIVGILELLVRSEVL